VQLPPAALGALSASCRGLRAACGDGQLWRALLAQIFPGSAALAQVGGGWELGARW
jgi:hypothetical protein